MFSVSDYTFAPYKVVWGRIASDVAAAVVGTDVIPHETVSLVGTPTEDEAYYIAAVLNSSPFRFSALAYSQAGGKSFGSPHFLDNLRVPKYISRNKAHRRLVELSRQASARQGEGVGQIESEIDQAALEVWGLTRDELIEIQRNLAELQVRYPVSDVRGLLEGGPSLSEALSAQRRVERGAVAAP
jgi:hypothetical protein